MSAKYIIRMDDACPTMCRSKWTSIENILDRYKIKPLVGVIPNNEDASLIYDDDDENFWDKVNAWKNKGWEIALHGYNHVYGSRAKSLITLSNASEFSGLPFEQQCDKIGKGIQVFKTKGLQPKVFIAPGHAFDKVTLTAIKHVSEINIISDGFYFRPVKYEQLNWVPQQLWQPRSMPFGLWTICLHPNTMDELDIQNIEEFTASNKKNIISINEINDYKPMNFFDSLFSKLFNKVILLKRL